MGGFFDPSAWVRAYRDPVAWLVLAVDLLPLVAIFGFGWGIDELVVFYWMENLVIGLAVWVRLVALGTLGGKRAAWFMMVFFPLHYGVFCSVHGAILLDLFSPDFVALPLFLGAVLLLEAVVFARYFIGEGRHRTGEPGAVMLAPYGRIVIVHLAIFAAAFSASAFGSPIGGALAILVLDVLWGMVVSVWRGVSAERSRMATAPS